jgi:predicted transcriptional regulator
VAATPPPAGAELEVLKVLWEHGAGTVREINDALANQGRAWAYTTVQTLLHRLETKGYVRGMKGKPAHVYEAVLSRDEVLKDRLRDLAEQMCDGTTSPLLHALVEGGKLSRNDVEALRKLIDKLDPPKKR